MNASLFSRRMISRPDWANSILSYGHFYSNIDIVGELLSHAQVGGVCAPRVSTIIEFANNINIRIN